jgi:hypothetical protein
MRIVKLIFISILLFLIIAAIYIYIPTTYKNKISDRVERLTAPSFDMPLDAFILREKSDIITEYKNREFNLRCHGNLRIENKIGKDNDSLCWAVISSAFDDIPAISVSFFFSKGKLTHIRLEFPEESFEQVQDYSARRFNSNCKTSKLLKGKTNIYGEPMITWVCKGGIIVTDKKTTSNRNVVVLWTSKLTIFSYILKRSVEKIKNLKKNEKGLETEHGI